MPRAFEITLQGTYSNQQVINRLNFYTSSDDTIVSGAYQLGLALAWDPLAPTTPAAASVLHGYLAAQTPAYQLTKIFSRNLFDPTDFFTTLPSGAGWAGASPDAGAPSLSFVASKLVTNRSRTDVRAGSLSLTPFAEANIGTGGVLTAGAIAVLQTLCDRLNEPPTYTSGGASAVYIPSVFKKVKYVPDPAKPTKFAYRYPDTLAAIEATSAIGIQWQPRSVATSQVSRRIGKGA